MLSWLRRRLRSYGDIVVWKASGGQGWTVVDRGGQWWTGVEGGQGWRVDRGGGWTVVDSGAQGCTGVDRGGQGWTGVGLFVRKCTWQCCHNTT